MAEPKMNLPSPPAEFRPLHWRDIVAGYQGSSGEPLPFSYFFTDLLDDVLLGEDDLELEEPAIEVEDRECGSLSWIPVTEWGEDEGLIQEWFDAGEMLEDFDGELLIEEPDRWERALGWVRSFAAVSKFKPVRGNL